jgi:hypothetical protein
MTGGTCKKNIFIDLIVEIGNFNFISGTLEEEGLLRRRSVSFSVIEWVR